MLLQPGPTLSTEHQQQQAQQQQQHQFQQHAPNLLSAQQPSSLTSSSSASSTPPIQDVSRYLETLQEQLKDGWTAHTAKDGRLYYCK
uniref:WW domain-containing protein n=1 Tax=Anopheles epiroticus TaxID=199890 RepID=A0A182PFF4_9DIPT